MITDVIANYNKNVILIIGDMNTDFIKINHNTKMLLELIKTNGLTIANIMQQQIIDFTYRKVTQNKCLSCWKDHLLCKRENLKNQAIRVNSKQGRSTYVCAIASKAFDKVNLQEAINTISKLGDKFEIKFNSEKIIYLILNKSHKSSYSDSSLTFNNEPIKRVNTFRYLGYELTKDMNDHIHIEKGENQHLPNL
ncbi:unnamed protein product [Brachionus calyciflorus]|uniref:Uncharacterized protein n=1 Tax=Brachionus calyciflorus TaxID=104777 RepID=A0A814KBF6_9BILA|nr:unnamed protein product [Brachionus calyciflorus]